MELFNKYESKYYNIVEELINKKESYTLSEVMEIISKHIKDNKFDQSFFEELIYKRPNENIKKNKKEDENFGGIFIEDDNKKNQFNPSIKGKIPIMLNNLEKQAIYSLIKSQKAASFLEEETIKKITDLYENDDVEVWNEKNIKIKNQAIKGDKHNSEAVDKMMRDIIYAIENKLSIIYDYKVLDLAKVKEQKKFTDIEAYPYKIEYSFLNDKFRVYAYYPKEDRFIKMNIDSINRLELGNTIGEIDLDDKFEKAREKNFKKVILSVEPNFNNVERCFRIFSYYERDAIYFKEDNLYVLEVMYDKNDETELIRDIMSLGDGVMVMYPERLREKIINRIRKCVENYK